MFYMFSGRADKQTMKPSSIISAGFLKEATCGGVVDKTNTHSHRWLSQTPTWICMARSVILLSTRLYVSDQNVSVYNRPISYNSF